MKSFGRMPTVRTPEASRYARPAAYWNSAFPFEGKGSATSITFNFEAKFPFTFVSAYCLPVYASQWPLPDTTQDSVHGCWLSFTTVVISNYRISCACKAQTGSPEAVTHLRFPQNVACGFPALRSSIDDSQHSNSLYPRTRNYQIHCNG
jgi:hypothetical protein